MITNSNTADTPGELREHALLDRTRSYRRNALAISGLVFLIYFGEIKIDQFEWSTVKVGESLAWKVFGSLLFYNSVLFGWYAIVDWRDWSTELRNLTVPEVRYIFGVMAPAPEREIYWITPPTPPEGEKYRQSWRQREMKATNAEGMTCIRYQIRAANCEEGERPDTAASVLKYLARRDRMEKAWRHLVAFWILDVAVAVLAIAGALWIILCKVF